MENDTEFLSESFKNSVLQGLEHEQKISMVTYVLGESGEARLKFIFQEMLARVNREDLMELLYTAAKELIVNSTKAAIKRIIFKELNLDIHNPEQYEEGMKYFKVNLTDRKFPAYKDKMKEQGYVVKISNQLFPKFIKLEVKNNFPLIPVEEDRVREKFDNAKKFDNLFEFFMEHGDNTEGAGMGITMVEILLSQSGFDRKLFSMATSKSKEETVGVVLVPLVPDHGLVAPVSQLSVE